MIRRKGIPEGGCSMCCRLKMKLEELWQRTSGCILKIRGVTPDGAGNFELEAGQNVNISEVSNGLRISTTGGVSYYTSDDPQLDIDNDDLKISLADVAKDSDLDVVAQNVANIVNGTTQVGDAAHADTADSATTAASATSATNSVNAQYLGSSKNNVGSDTKPVKIVNGQAVEVANNLLSSTIAPTGHGSGKYSMTIGKLGIVWGSTKINDSSSLVIRLPITFVSSDYIVLQGQFGKAGGDVYVNGWWFDTFTNTSFTIHNNSNGDSICMWLVVGRIA